MLNDYGYSHVWLLDFGTTYFCKFSVMSHIKEKKNSLMFSPRLPTSLLREFSHHNHCSWCLLGESVFPAAQLAPWVATAAWRQLCRCHQMLPPSPVLSWRCFCFHISFKLLFRCQALSEFYWKIASSALNLIFLLFMWQNPSLGLFGKMTSAHPIICHFPLIFPRFLQSPSPTYFISFFQQKKYKTSTVSNFIQMDTQFGRWPSDSQIRKPSFGLSSVQ